MCLCVCSLSGSDRGSRVPSGAVAGSVRALLADMLSQERLLQAGPGGSGSGSGTENKEARSELEAWLESQSQSQAETGLGGGGDGAVDVCDVAVAVRGGSDDKDQGWDKDDNDDDDNNTISTAALTVASSSSGRSGGGNDRNSNRSGGGGTSAGSAVKRERGTHPFWTRLPAAAAHNPSAAPGSSSSSSSGDLAGDNVGVGRSAAYQKMLAGRRGLPAWASRAEFLSTMEAHRAVVVTGETGCGKTTQIPQFLHEAAGGRAKIVVCQPRRLAAVGVATRVAEELASAIGEEVGYMVKGDSKASARTRIVFVTYGVLLRRLKDDPSLAAIDYVILDEVRNSADVSHHSLIHHSFTHSPLIHPLTYLLQVHERGVDSDFTLALLMSALTATSASGGGGSASKRLKLILMSATMATDKFATYLGQVSAGAVSQSTISISPINTTLAHPLTHPPPFLCPGSAPVCTRARPLHPRLHLPRDGVLEGRLRGDAAHRGRTVLPQRRVRRRGIQQWLRRRGGGWRSRWWGWEGPSSRSRVSQGGGSHRRQAAQR